MACKIHRLHGVPHTMRHACTHVADVTCAHVAHNQTHLSSVRRSHSRGAVLYCHAQRRNGAFELSSLMRTGVGSKCSDVQMRKMSKGKATDLRGGEEKRKRTERCRAILRRSRHASVDSGPLKNTCADANTSRAHMPRQYGNLFNRRPDGNGYATRSDSLSLPHQSSRVPRCSNFHLLDSNLEFSPLTIRAIDCAPLTVGSDFSNTACSLLRRQLMLRPAIVNPLCLKKRTRYHFGCR